MLWPVPVAVLLVLFCCYLLLCWECFFVFLFCWSVGLSVRSFGCGFPSLAYWRSSDRVPTVLRVFERFGGNVAVFKALKIWKISNSAEVFKGNVAVFKALKVCEKSVILLRSLKEMLLLSRLKKSVNNQWFSKGLCKVVHVDFCQIDKPVAVVSWMTLRTTS